MRLQLSGFWQEGCFPSIRPKTGIGLRWFVAGEGISTSLVPPWQEISVPCPCTTNSPILMSRFRSWLKAQPCSAHPPYPHQYPFYKVYDLFHALGGQEKAKMPSVPSDESRNLTLKCNRKKQLLLPKHPAKENSWAQRQNAPPEPGYVGNPADLGPPFCKQSPRKNPNHCPKSKLRAHHCFHQANTT